MKGALERISGHPLSAPAATGSGAIAVAAQWKTGTAKKTPPKISQASSSVQMTFTV